MSHNKGAQVWKNLDGTGGNRTHPNKPRRKSAVLDGMLLLRFKGWFQPPLHPSGVEATRSLPSADRMASPAAPQDHCFPSLPPRPSPLPSRRRPLHRSQLPLSHPFLGRSYRRRAPEFQHRRAPAQTAGGAGGDAGTSFACFLSTPSGQPASHGAPFEAGLASRGEGVINYVFCILGGGEFFPLKRASAPRPPRMRKAVSPAAFRSTRAWSGRFVFKS